MKRLGWSVLAGALACNAAALYAFDSSKSPLLTKPVATAPHRQAEFHVNMKQSVEFLASDALEGRLIGTPGIDQASDFIADTFSRLGLQTVPGLEGYFQPFTLTTHVDPDAHRSVLAIGDRKLKLDQDYIPLHLSAEGSARGPVVFVGYGIVDPAHHLDDYAGQDVKGKIVLLMRYEPHRDDGTSKFAPDHADWSTDATIPQKIQNAIDRGASAVVLVNPPMYHSDEGLIPFFRQYPFKAKAPVVQVSVEVADQMLKESGAPPLKTLQTALDQTVHSTSLALKNTEVTLTVAFARTQKKVRNVVALLPGKGAHADEYVVVGAHYDHLGHGGPGSLAPWSHGIHHGADDNASGTTAMLALADRFAHLGPQPRSIVFIAFTAEEEGLLGSAHFVNNCPIATGKIVSMLNLDMVGRVRDEMLLIGGEGTAENFPGMVKQADEGLPLKLGQFGKGGIGPSDHTSFALKKIPVLFFFSGMHMDYHRPTDTADKINFEGMKQVVELGERIVEAMTTMPREQYVSKYDGSGLPGLMMKATGAAVKRASLGAIPDYAQGEDATEGMRIGGIVPGSPADKLGLKQGDLIVRFNGAAIGNMMEYTAALDKAKPGQTVQLKILRDKHPIELDATLVTRKE